MAEVQDYVEDLTRAKIAELPDGVWYTEDYIDQDPALGEGLIPITMRMTIDGDTVHYDLSDSHASISSMLSICTVVSLSTPCLLRCNQFGPSGLSSSSKVAGQCHFCGW